MARISNYLESKDSSIDKEVLASKINDIFELSEFSYDINAEMSKNYQPGTLKEISRRNGQLFSAATSYRTAVDTQLKSKLEADRMLVKYNIDDFETIVNFL